MSHTGGASAHKNGVDEKNGANGLAAERMSHVTYQKKMIESCHIHNTSE
jgi:hypothetical protein